MFECEEKDRGSLVNNYGMFVNDLSHCLQASPLRDRDLGVHPKEIVCLAGHWGHQTGG